MKTRQIFHLAGVFLGVTLGAQAAPFLVPNGDFSTAEGADWTQGNSDGTVITYEATGGNGGGFAKIDNTAGQWGGVLVSEGGSGPNPATGSGVPLSVLGLTAGETYTFSLDLINLGADANSAGMKMESWGPSGFLDNGAGDVVFPLTTSWATYSFEYTINPAATALKFVPLLVNNAGPVGYDNVGGDNTPVVPPPFEPLRITNGDFEIPNGAGWGTSQGTPVFNTIGGNPSGHVVLDGSDGFAVLYAFNNVEVNFADLGLAPGDTYFVKLDMKVNSGLFAGGIRLEGPEGYVVESYPSVIGNGSTWETYTIELTVPASPARAKFGLRPGGSVMAFDNVSIVLPADIPFAADIEQVTVVSWSPTSSENRYQPQQSADNATWTDLGPLLQGNTVNSILGEGGANFYRVQEFTISSSELTADGGFEQGGQWALGNGNIPAEEVEDAALAHTGDWFVRLAVDNGAVDVPNKSIVQQSSVLGAVAGGDVLNFSFWANVQSNNGAVFNYSIKWREATDGIVIGQVDGVLGNDLPIGVWTETSVLGLVAPAGTDSALVEIEAVTGAVAEQAGVVLIDDISLMGEESTLLGTLAASSVAGVQISWPTAEGRSYQPQVSTDLMTFTDFGSALSGSGSRLSVVDPLTPDKKFYQVVETP